MKLPDFSYEKLAWEKGYSWVLGVDEVGRGSFAGPVVAGAVALKISSKYQVASSRVKKSDLLSTNYKLLTTVSQLEINDSKKLTAEKRVKLAREIKKYFYWGIGEASVGEINRMGIVAATQKAMRLAIKDLIARMINNQKTNYKQIPKQTPFVLVDAFYIKYLSGIGLKNQKAIIGGDSKSISIAAASIIAKVYRDTLMRKLSLLYRKYHWERNKGYGTEKHRQIILEYGTVRFHRVKYIESWMHKELV